MLKENKLKKVGKNAHESSDREKEKNKCTISNLDCVTIDGTLKHIEDSSPPYVDHTKKENKAKKRG